MVNKWEIYFCSLDPTEGSEQRGTRPVLVISTDAVNHNLTVSTVLPISSIKENSKIYPTEVFLAKEISGLPKDSVAMVQQIRTVSNKRLTKVVSKITDINLQNEILDACKNYFEF